MAEPADIYNSNNVPHGIPGGTVIFVRRGGTAIDDGTGGARVIDGNFSPKKDGVLIERPSQNKGDGGWAIANAAKAGEVAQKIQKTSIVIQYPSTDAEKIDLGYYYDVEYGNETARWVVHSAGEVFGGGDYWKQNLDVVRDNYAAEDAGDADKAAA